MNRKAALSARIPRRDQSSNQDIRTGGPAPTIREIAHLATRLRAIAPPDTDPAERAAVLADKAALLARITHHTARHSRDAEPRRHDRNGGDR